MAKTVLILIRLLPQKPADLDQHCFQKRVQYLENVHSGLNMLNTASFIS